MDTTRQLNSMPQNTDNFIYVMPGESCDRRSRREYRDRYYDNDDSASLLNMVLTIGAIFIIMYLLWSAMNMCNMDYISNFFTPPEEEILNELKNKPITEVPPLNFQELKDSFQENFENDLPNQTKPLPLDNEMNYSDTAANMALEQSVKDQHKKYVNQREKFTGTASFNPERSDSQDIVTFVGLRRPSYLTNSGETLVDPSARQVPTVVDPKSLSKPVNLTWNYGSFT